MPRTSVLGAGTDWYAEILIERHAVEPPVDDARGEQRAHLRGKQQAPRVLIDVERLDADAIAGEKQLV